jgi:branched-chain amino acid transport system substrate-binding protein
VKVTFGLSLPLTGKYAAMGRQAEAALHYFANAANQRAGLKIGNAWHEVDLICIDDESSPARCAEIYRSLCFEKRADVILGPYSSALARAAAPIVESARMIFVNHGGADDALYDRGYHMIVGVLSPASDYLRSFVRMLATLKFWRKRVALVATMSPFARAVAAGVEEACAERAARRRGVKVRVKWNAPFNLESSSQKLFPALVRNRINALVSAGSFAHDVAVVRAVVAANLNIPVVACVAAGVGAFGAELGEQAEGIVGPAQWDESLDFAPELGVRPREFARAMRALSGAPADYTAAQAYAAAILAAAALEKAGTLDQERLRAEFSELRTSTLFGSFAIDRVTGRQIDHRMLLVQWHGGRKLIIEPEAHVEKGDLEFPSGWRIILAGIERLKLTRDRNKEEEPETNDPK